MPNETIILLLRDIDLQDRTFRFRVRLRVDGLAGDIKKNGQDFPVVVRPVEGQGEYQLVCGFRRVAALQTLGHDEVLAAVRELTDDEAYRLAWSENEQRKSYNDLDRAHAILKANQAGKTMKQLETVFGLSRKQLTRLKLLTKTPKRVQKALEEGTISTTHAIALNEMRARYGKKLDLDHWIQAISDEELSVQQLRNRITRVYKPKEAAMPSLVTFENGGAQIHIRKLVPSEMSVEERAQAITELEHLLILLRQHTLQETA